jgi:hypothetical protein
MPVRCDHLRRADGDDGFPALPHRQVKLANPDVVSYGGLTTCTSYHLIPKQESVVDSVFMADKFTSSPARPGGDDSVIVVTEGHVFSMADEDE